MLAMVLPRSERFAALPQFVALWASLLAVVLIARRLGLPRAGSRIRWARLRDAAGRPAPRRRRPERPCRRVVPPRRGGASWPAARGQSSSSGASRSGSRCRRSSTPCSRSRSSSPRCSPGACTTARREPGRLRWGRAARGALVRDQPRRDGLARRRARGHHRPGSRPLRSAASSGRCAPSCSTSSTHRVCGARSCTSRSWWAPAWSHLACCSCDVLRSPVARLRAADSSSCRSRSSSGSRAPHQLRLAALLVQDRAEGHLARSR